MIFRDGETIYTLNYAERGKPFSGKDASARSADAEKILAEVFGPVTLELTGGLRRIPANGARNGEEPPCPA